MEKLGRWRREALTYHFVPTGETRGALAFDFLIRKVERFGRGTYAIVLGEGRPVAHFERLRDAKAAVERYARRAVETLAHAGDPVAMLAADTLGKRGPLAERVEAFLGALRAAGYSIRHTWRYECPGAERIYTPEDVARYNLDFAPTGETDCDVERIIRHGEPTRYAFTYGGLGNCARFDVYPPDHPETPAPDPSDALCDAAARSNMGTALARASDVDG